MERQNTSSINRLLGLLGIIAVILAWLSILLAIIVSGCFNIVSMALSDLGDWVSACNGDPLCISMCNRLSEPIFNYGLIISGTLLAITTMGLYKFSKSYPIFITVAGITLALIGFLPERFGICHFMSALAFFLTLLIAMIVYSVINRRKGLLSKMTLILAFVSFIGLVLFIAIELGFIDLGYAIPEIIGALPASIWISLLFYNYLIKRS